MGQPMPGDGPHWTIRSVVPNTILDAGNMPTKVQTVTYQLASGATGTVDIPVGEFSPQTVRERVQAAAADLHTIVTMTG